MARPSSIDQARVRFLTVAPPRREATYVLLWIQQDVRATCNHALEYAIEEANVLGLPLLACYGICERFPGASERAFRFLLEGLRELSETLIARGIRLACLRKSPPDAVCDLAEGAATIVTDRGYARICRRWRNEVAKRLPDTCLVQVETNVVVPVEIASKSLEPAAATLRPKLLRHLPRFLTPPRRVALEHPNPHPELPSHASTDVPAIEDLDVDTSVPRAPGFVGGEAHARERLRVFEPKLASYGTGKANDPSVQETSFLSPYLHFGHVSALELALWAQRAQKDGAQANSGSQLGATAFLEEVIVRRELARNMCSTCDHYDSFDVLPHWAKTSLMQHANDPRPKLYSLEQLSRGETDDPWWNAAQWEMVGTGHMHNYMRMYWCKQLILWTPDPRTAFDWAVRLNDRYSLDGRDENGYMGIAWCFGHHDRPFPERAIFGEVRSMTKRGIEGKFNMDRYRQLVWRKCRNAVAAEPRLMMLLPSAAFGSTGGASGSLFCMFKPTPVTTDMPGAKADVASSRTSVDQDVEAKPVTPQRVTPKHQESADDTPRRQAKKPRKMPENSNGLLRFFSPALARIAPGTVSSSDSHDKLAAVDVAAKTCECEEPGELALVEISE